MKNMKKITSMLLAAAILSAAVTVPFCVSAAGSVLYGDVNSDGSITGADSNMLCRVISGTYAGEYSVESVDISNDDNVNAIDRNLLKQMIVGENSAESEAVDSEEISDGYVPVPSAASSKEAYAKYLLTRDGKVLVHTYSDMSVDNSEDNSETVAYHPMLSETNIPSSGGEYNVHRILLEDLKPGVVCNNVIIGYDGYMFYADSVDTFTGNGFLSKTIYDRTVRLLKSSSDWAEANGMKYYVAIVPNKNTVYSEYMPEGYEMGEYRRIDQFCEILDESGVEYVDLRWALANAREESPERNLYHKYDTHWNQHAGFIGYSEIMNMIAEDYPSVVIHDKSEYQINYMETYMKDMAWYLGYYSYFREYAPQYTLKSGNTARILYYEPKNAWGQFQFAYEFTTGNDRGYSDKLYRYTYQNDHNTASPSVYCMVDMANIALVPFLKDSFYKSDYNLSYSIQSNKNDILESGADILISVVSERNLKSFVNYKAVTLTD